VDLHLIEQASLEKLLGCCGAARHTDGFLARRRLGLRQRALPRMRRSPVVPSPVICMPKLCRQPGPMPLWVPGADCAE
jgi:hypothetical protein